MIREDRKINFFYAAIFDHFWATIASSESHILSLLFPKESFCNWSIWCSTFVNGRNKTIQKYRGVKNHKNNCNFWTNHAIRMPFEIYNLQKIANIIFLWQMTETLTDWASMAITRNRTDRQTDNATNRLNRPRCQFRRRRNEWNCSKVMWININETFNYLGEFTDIWYIYGF